ncbi:MAG TPA: phosphohistidine phosphatase SixA [Bryobacteraceae bacterium]|nr:phosphohistidine phosphatase SixA [Bryobacteraceae bacterium]
MELYILRHGIAEDGQPGGRDANRALTPEGKRRLRDVLRLAATAGVSPKCILTSPYVRAVQTAQIAAEVLGHRSELLRTEALAPDSDPRTVWEEIRAHRSAGALLMAGHEPLLSRMIAHLLGSPSLFVDMKKGALVRVDVDQFGPEPHGVLKWMLVPKLASS